MYPLRRDDDDERLAPVAKKFRRDLEIDLVAWRLELEQLVDEGDALRRRCPSWLKACSAEAADVLNDLQR